tara:strand:- start:1564 stop:2403 length:840 start_codon:yes stop_codon:yes gene_type:complete
VNFSFGQRSLDLSTPRVMGILNVTPDSFSDGGLHNTPDAALRYAEQMVHDGAELIDVGGESTRPGAAVVSLQEELDRVIPVVERIRAQLDIVISVDTSSPQVMTEAASAGAGLINDVRSLQRPGALAAAVSTGLPVCLMHMQGEPGTMQQNPQYTDVVAEVSAFLQRRAAECEAAGIRREQILLDPGFGFGKSLEHNFRLLNQLRTLTEAGYPLLTGLSRKRMIAGILDDGVTPEGRDPASMAAAVICAMQGAAIIRTHNVSLTRDALRVVIQTLKENE